MASAIVCIDPDHHVDTPKSFVREVESVCHERGLRLTPIRARVLKLIAGAGKPMKAYDLLEQLRDKKGAGADAPPTIYRALDFLVSNGFVHKLQSINAFVSCHHPGSAEHSAPFLICVRCERSVELEDNKVALQLDKAAKSLGFSPIAQTLEVHGLCVRCAD